MSNEKHIFSPHEHWKMLRSGSGTSTEIEVVTKPSNVMAPAGPVRFALGRNGEACILLPLAGGENPYLVKGAPALSVEIATFVEARRPKRFLALTCLVEELEAVFVRVAEQILERVKNGVGSVEAAHLTVEEFRRLLLRASARDVSLSRVAGLVGELLVLKRLIDRSASAWETWRGPAGARHDFCRGNTAMEVKVTLGRGRTSVSIHGLEQLSEPSGGKLYLQHFELEQVADGLLSVSALGNAVLSASQSPDAVRELLLAVGCADVDDPAWNSASFRSEGEALYEILPGFPRLVSSMLSEGATAGLSGVHYNVELAFAADFKVGKDQVSKIEELLVCGH